MAMSFFPVLLGIIYLTAPVEGWQLRSHVYRFRTSTNCRSNSSCSSTTRSFAQTSSWIILDSKRQSSKDNHSYFWRQKSSNIMEFPTSLRMKEDQQNDDGGQSDDIMLKSRTSSASNPLTTETGMLQKQLSADPPLFFWNNPILAAVDFAAIFIFAGIGKANHDTTGAIDIASVMSTAFPFLLAWYGTSPFTGVYKNSNRMSRRRDTTADGGNYRTDRNDDGSSAGEMVLESGKLAAQGWIVAVPLGCVLRGLIKGYPPPVPFVIVTMIATLVILGGARMLYTAAVVNFATTNE